MLKIKQDTKYLILLVVGGLCIISSCLCLLAPVVAGILNWIWPICILYVSRYRKQKSTYIMVFLTLSISFIIKYLGFFGTLTTAQLLSELALGVEFAIVFFAAYVVDKIFYNKLPVFLATLIFPTMYVCCAIVFMMIGYANSSNPASLNCALPIIAQSMSVVGETGLAFIMMWFASCVCSAIHKDSFKPSAITAICIVLVLVVFGTIRIANQKPAEHNTHVAIGGAPIDLVFSDLKVKVEFREMDRNMKNIEAYLQRATDQNADIICFSEEAFNFNKDEENIFINNINALSCKYKLPIILPVNIDSNKDQELIENFIVYFDSKGNYRKNYKDHLFPIIETQDYKDGDDGPMEANFTTKDGHEVKFAAAMCFDAQFERDLINLSTDDSILFIPSFDWDYSNMFTVSDTAVRAYEEGITVVKPTYGGYTYAMDAYGTLTHFAETREASKDVVVKDIPIRRVDTEFPECVDFLYAFYFIVLIVLIGIALGKNTVKNMAASADRAK